MLETVYFYSIRSPLYFEGKEKGGEAESKCPDGHIIALSRESLLIMTRTPEQLQRRNLIY